MVFAPKHEDITGSNLTGSDGASNRTYTLANSNAQAAQMIIIIENAALQAGIDYSLSSDVITFLNNVFDDQNITIDYLVTDESSGVTYTDTLQVARIGGMAVEIKNENLGTGDSSNKSFDLVNGNVIADSYTLKHSTTGDNENNFTTLVESTHYTIDKDGGSVLLTTAGVTELGSDVLYMDYMHSPKASDTLLATYLVPASAETNLNTGNYWGPVKTTTDEVQDGREDNPYPETDRPYVSDFDTQDSLQLDNLSVQSITSIEFLTGTSTRTLDSDNYRFDEWGFITLLVDKLPLGRINVHITYTHGYDVTPPLITELTAHYAAIRAFVLISGGSYDDATSYTLGRKAITIGEAWVNIREVIDQSKKRIKEILNQHGPKMDVF